MTNKYCVEKMVVNNSKRGVACFNEKNECIYANSAVLKMFGGSEDIKTFGEVFMNWYEKEKENTYGEDDFIRYHDEVRGKDRYFNIEEQCLINPQVDSRDMCYIVVDLTSVYNARKNELYVRSHDILTNLYTKEYFIEKTGEILKTAQEDYVILCLDVKEFKLVNDQCGYLQGNDVLIKLAGILQVYEDEKCVCSRLENDKFATCMPKKQFDENKEVIREKLDNLYQVVGKIRHMVSVYMGIYEVTDRKMTVMSMCDRAHVAINTIKGSRDELTAYFEEGMLEEIATEQRMLSEVDEAIAKGQFTIHLQPQVDAGGHAIGAESLVRWNHPEKGFLPPGKFIEVFEKNGIIYKLDMFVWEATCKILRKWKQQGYGERYLSVNISAKDFAYVDIYEELTTLVEKYDISPGQLHLELTETVAAEDLKAFNAVVMKLREYGFLVEIDDFGAGYASLNMLREVHVDVLKIDRGFLTQVEKSRRSRAILRAVIGLARQLEMKIIVEGVENELQLDFLKTEGVAWFQGFYFSKPLPIEKFEDAYIA